MRSILCMPNMTQFEDRPSVSLERPADIQPLQMFSMEEHIKRRRSGIFRIFRSDGAWFVYNLQFYKDAAPTALQNAAAGFDKPPLIPLPSHLRTPAGW